jgi:glycosyltransferase involved in cell wall biosynthesis
VKPPPVSILSAGRDPHYALGLASALAGAGVPLDFIGGDELAGSTLRGQPAVNYFNLRGDQSVGAGALRKMLRVLVYYFRLIKYAATARPKIFHILWNNKFELFDRTVLMLFYRLLGKKIAFTVHNVNARTRDGGDSWLNRATLRFQYRCCDRFFLHTERMRAELITEFGVPRAKTVLIPYGLNDVVPMTSLTRAAARQKLGLAETDRVILFYGNIAPYKGAEFLVAAFEMLAPADERLRLVIAGRPKGEESYWAGLSEKINRSPQRGKMILKIEFVSDADTEVCFKAADVLALPYRHIFQSGVLFLGYNYGVPVVATDVGSLREDILEGETGHVCEPDNAAALAAALKKFFAGGLYARLAERRADIRAFAIEHHSWSKVAALTGDVYHQLAQNK